jgi:hypothetical protein
LQIFILNFDLEQFAKPNSGHVRCLLPQDQESGVWRASQVSLLVISTKPNESRVWPASQVKQLFNSTKPNESGVWKASQVKLLIISTKPNQRAFLFF